MKIISYNLNGIRAAMGKDLAGWLSDQNADVFCIQESKAQPDQVDVSPFEELGYTAHWHSAEKKGYSGVITFTKATPDKVEIGCGHELYDNEGRVIRTDIGELTILNIYFPSGTTGDVRQSVKMEFLDFIFDHIAELRKTRPNLVVCGDYNIAHNEVDIHNPKGLQTTSGFLPEEREWMTKYFNSGMIDTFRHFHKDPHQYSWWSYRAGARQRNKGWRIDYIAASEPLADKLVNADIHQDAVHSDHCPISLELKM